MVGSSAFKPSGAPGSPTLVRPGTNRRLTGDECSPAGGAALLTIPVGEDRSFLADTVNVGRLIPHHAHVVSTDIENSNVITHYHQDIGFACLARLLSLRD